MKNEKRTLILTTLVCLLPLIAGAVLYKDLPETMATHWNLQGEADGWSGRAFAVFGLPGHPAAACTSAQLFVLPLLRRLAGEAAPAYPVPAILTDPVSANHGRAQYTAVKLERRGGALYALRVRSKSGLITALAGADGWFCIPRDREGVPAGEQIDVYLYD